MNHNLKSNYMETKMTSTSILIFVISLVNFWAGYFIGVLHTKYRKYDPKPTTDEPDWGAGL